MPQSTSVRYGSWLKAPVRSQLGTISLVGSIKDTRGINPQSMRILGSYALILIRSGKGRYQDANGRDLSFKAGDAILVFPDLPHAYGPNASRKWEQIYTVFNGPQFELLQGAGILNPANPIWSLGAVDHWQHRLEEIFQVSPPQGELSSARTLGRFSALLSDMAATQAETKLSPGDAWLGESMHLLAEPSSQGWLTPQEAAQRVGLSYENFRKLFAKRVGESPGAFQKRRRIEHACAMIYQSSRSLKDLADEHGFCDVFHFSKVFSQVMGESPSAYRKRVNGS
ncbi:helix-turn-helix domain-containing protein [Pelagicoccus sp. NFK12]|uniref:Helix-turn-helix domain-containing protein n=1 Tax=Pelagicoccus enzymogenes TaxID=2773457 RepID=A0A927IG16_9BACT|nr:helix-turn-helix domain-containing protein [Pelagicoccus enzymogenes]MBD5777900.1 helix-turn-helix domain-containing protein [Pelagicoccus enzymogenes]